MREDHGIHLVLEPQAAVCAVFAPSQVAALAAIVGGLGTLVTQFCAIGETTATRVRSVLGIEVHVARPDDDEIAAAVRALVLDRNARAGR